MSAVNIFNSIARAASNAGNLALGTFKAHPASLTLATLTAVAAGATFNRIRQQNAADLFVNGPKVKEGETRRPVKEQVQASLEKIQETLKGEFESNSKLLKALRDIEKTPEIPATEGKARVPATSHYDLPAMIGGVTKEFQAARAKLIREIEAQLKDQNLPAIKTALKNAVRAQMERYAAAEGVDLEDPKVKVKEQFDGLLKKIEEAQDFLELAHLAADIRKAVVLQEGSNPELNTHLQKFAAAVSTDDFLKAYTVVEDSHKGIDALILAASKLDTAKKDVAPVLAELAKILDGTPATEGENAKPKVEATFDAFVQEKENLSEASNRGYFAAVLVLAALGAFFASAGKIPALQQNVIQKLPVSVRPWIA